VSFLLLLFVSCLASFLTGGTAFLDALFATGCFLGDSFLAGAVFLAGSATFFFSFTGDSFLTGLAAFFSASLDAFLTSTLAGVFFYSCTFAFGFSSTLVILLACFLAGEGGVCFLVG
jgi:hypothetical protein